MSDNLLSLSFFSDLILEESIGISKNVVIRDAVCENIMENANTIDEARIIIKDNIDDIDEKVFNFVNNVFNCCTICFSCWCGVIR